MKSIVNVARLHMLNRWNLIYTPLLVFGSAWILNSVVIWVILANSDEPHAQIATGSVQAVLWALMAAALISVTQTFPFSFSLSLTRKTYYLGTFALYAAYSCIAALLFATLAQIETGTNGLGMGLWYLNVPPFTQGSFPIQFLTFFGSFFFMLNTGFWIGALYKRAGTKGLLLCAGAIVVLVALWIIVTTMTSSWPAVGAWITQLNALKVSVGLIILGFIEGLTCWIFLRRATP